MSAIRAATTVSLGVAVLLAAALLAYSLQGIEWRQVARIAAEANPTGLGVCMLLASVTLFMRALRWRILLNAEGFVSAPTAFWATAAGSFGNNFLPARAGELIRAYMISSRSSLENSYVLATALSDRAADAIVLILMSAIVMLALPAQPSWLATAVRSGAVLGVVGALAIVVLPLLAPRTTTIIERFPLPQGIRTMLVGVITAGMRGMRSLHNPRRLSGFLALTIVIWSLDVYAAVLAAQALGLEMPIAAAFLLIAGLGLGSALPSTPGYVGIYQFVAVTVLAPFGFSRTDAIAYILIVQALSYLVIGGWGGIGLWSYGRRRRLA
jgi:glycosyltransferase 2 family protein